MSKHTPGDWGIDDFDRIYLMAGDKYLGIIESKTTTTDTDELDRYVSHEEALANAALIMTAPDLLEALQAVVSAHAHIETCDMPQWLEDAEAAITKAT